MTERRAHPSRGRVALFLGPLSVGLALVLLLANRHLFESGPGAPTAGRPAAWGVLWVAVAVVAAGHLASGTLAGVRIAVGVRRRERLEPVVLASAIYHVVVAAGAVILWFAP